jgi:hypothetical protein
MHVWTSPSGILENQLLARRLAVHGYHQTKFTAGLCEHVSCPINFTLVVDDFGVQYVGGEHDNHLITALEQSFTVSKYWSGSYNFGIVLYWDYKNKHIALSMPCYITDALHKCQHPMPKRPHHALDIRTDPAYG